MDKIPEDAKLKLIALQVLAKEHWKFVENCIKASAHITGERDDQAGHTADWIMGEAAYDLDELWIRTAVDREESA